MCRLRCEKLFCTNLWEIQYTLSKWFTKVKRLNYRVTITIVLNCLVYLYFFLIQLCLPSITKLKNPISINTKEQFIDTTILTFSKPK